MGHIVGKGSETEGKNTRELLYHAYRFVTCSWKRNGDPANFQIWST